MKLTTSTHLKLFITYSSIISFATLLVAFFMLNPVSTDTSATTSFNVNHSATGYTLSLELVGANPGTVALSADTSAGGTWVAGKQTVRATTNSPAGYQLFLSMDGATNSLTGSNDDTHTLPAGGGSLSSPATLALNRWGYAIPDQTGYDGAFSGDYTIAPDSTISNSTTWATMPNVSAPVLVDTVTGQPAGATTTKDLNIYYGAAADIGLVSDTYLGTVLYSAISDTSSTGTESASINPSSQKVTDTNISVDITTPLYTTTDLTTSDVTATIGGATCPVTAVNRNPAGSSNPNAVVVTCTAPAAAAPGKKDVVVSISKFGKSYTITNGYEYKAAPSNITELENLQQLAEYPGVCTNTTIGTIASGIKDARDNTTYTIARLADGKCWMLDNLALDLTNSTILNAMDQDNTNASNTTLNYLRNGGGTSSDQYAITGVVNWTDSPTYASSYSYSDPLVNLTNKDIIPTDATSTAGQYKVGGYYNYCAATAGSYCYGNGTSQGTSSGNATEDICPAGWRLPTGKTSGEFSALANAIYGSTGSTSDPTAYANYRAALHLPLSGTFSFGARGFQGRLGYWWSSTWNYDYYMYGLRADTSSIYPANDYSRSDGYSIRCTSS